MNSYQKLKAENEQLKQDIYNLVRNAQKIQGIETRLRYEIIFSAQDNVWFGAVPVLPAGVQIIDNAKA